jgi:RNA polymerase sigma-70 factor (ECF subfamily)
MRPRLEPPDLVARLRRGEEAAFEELVRSFGGRLLAVAKRFLPNEEDAQDALQDAFLSAFRSIDRFEERSQLTTWLHSIVVRACLMKLRTRRRKHETPIEDLLPQYLEDGHMVNPAARWSERPETLLQRSEIRSLVRQSIERLPDSYRTVLLLRDIEERDTEETARLLELTPNAVKVRLHRARQALRGLLDPQLRALA